MGTKMLALVAYVLTAGCLAASGCSRSVAPVTPSPTATAASPAPPYVSEQARSSDAFVDFIGVDTHFAYPGSTYASSSAESAIENLGIRHFRDNASLNTNRYARIMATGIHLDAYWPIFYFYGPVSSWTPAPDVFATAVGASSLDSYEGTNEPNTCGGVPWMPGVVAQQESLFTFMRSTPSLQNLPLLNYATKYCGGIAGGTADAEAMGSVLSAYSNFGNVHPYPPVYQSVQSIPEQGCYSAAQCPAGVGTGGTYYQETANILNPGQPIIATETGYENVASAFGVGPVGQERYDLRLLLNLWNQGVRRVYLFELLDAYANDLSYYGLMSDGYVAYPSYTALRNLISTLTDPGPTFSAGSLNYALGGSLANVNHVLLQKRSGTFEEILWQAVPSVTSNDIALVVAPQTVTLTFPAPPSSITAQTFTDTGTLSSVAVTVTGSVASAPVADIPVIVTVNP